jgi:hypothetical protein
MSKKNGAARPTRTRAVLGLPRRRRATPQPPAGSAARAPATPQPPAGSAARAPATPQPRAESAARPPAPPSHEQIARRAYELHRSGAEGDALAHWLAAERELVGN